MSMSESTTNSQGPPMFSKIDVGDDTEINAVTFTANGEYLVSGDDEGVRVWRVQDGKEMAAMKTWEVYCLAVSQDGRWIAAGTSMSEVFVWDAKTYKQVFAHSGRSDLHATIGVDFSPDSIRLVTASRYDTVTVWNIAARQRVRTLHHEDVVIAAKYSPQGDRIVTATDRSSVRVWDSNYGRLLVDIPMQVTPLYNTGLLWFNNHLFVVSKNIIKQIDASTGSTVSEWPVSAANYSSCISLPCSETFISYATATTVAFWDTSTHTQFNAVQHLRHIRSITHSPDGQHLAIGGLNGTITIKHVSHITDTIPLSRLHPTFKEPEIRIDDSALDSWIRDQLADAETLLTEAIRGSQDTTNYVLASRALVRTRLGQWDTAIIDAEESIKFRPSVIGYIAKFATLVGKGAMHEAYRTFDIAFEHFHSTHVTLLLLIKAVVVFMAGEHEDAISRVDDLIAAVRFKSTFYVVQAYMHFLLGNSYIENGEYDHAIQSFDHARTQLGDRTTQPPLVVSLISGWKFDGLAISIEQRFCEALYAAGRTKEARESLLTLVDEEVNIPGSTIIWVTNFLQRFLSTHESSDDPSWKDDTPMLSTTPRPPSLARLLREWTRLKLLSGSWRDALVASLGFAAPRFVIYRTICEHLKAIGHISDTVACFHQMCSELTQETQGEQADWVLNFKSRCLRELGELGDTAINTRQYDEAISHYTVALSLDLTSPQALLVRRSKAHAGKGSWQDALNDANEVIKLDPSSSMGYERKHAALHGAACYDDAIEAFETMLSKMLDSSDPEICNRARQYVTPAETKETIRVVIENTIRESPLVLIDTASGRLVDKPGQTSSFESHPIFGELVSAMTTQFEHGRIEREVAQYYRYATFSHKWQDNEPLFETVSRIAVYDLEESPTHDKLKMFCKIAREAGLNWAWSDTCCINKGDHFVLQEALISMFKWYQGSSLTIIFLLGVRRPSQHGALIKSIWNTRAWTFQEYHASKMVRFYTEDWTLYMDLDIPNHKESPEIVSEMEEATGVSARTLVALRPGLDDVREKLRLASARKTSRVEDAAYSLLGIFSLSLGVVYGEGDKALGRLLAQLLTSSGDTSILAWTGRSGSFNSCLPANITVFSQLPISHIPPTVTGTDTDAIVSGSRVTSLNIALVTKLYDGLRDLSVPSFAGRRMKLPCLTFKLGRVAASRHGSESIFRAQTSALGIVEIRTEENLSRLDSLYLIHPWIDFLLDRQPVGNITEAIPEENIDDDELGELPSLPSHPITTSNATQRRAAQFVARFGLPFNGLPNMSARDVTSLRPPSTVSPMEKQTQVLQFIARLRQPFGALLLTPTRQHVEEYRRVVAETLITVQVEEITSTVLDKLIHGVRMLDVL